MKKYIHILMVTILSFSCKDKIHKTDITDSIIPVVVTKSKQIKFIPKLEFSGTAFANKEANLGTAIPGRIEKIYFNEGQKVNKGDLLVELSSELYMQALIERDALKKDFDRVSRLREKGSLSEQDFDHVKAKYDASVAKTQMMKKNSEIRAPFSGIIVDHIVKEGENYFFAPSLKPGYSTTSGIIKLMQLSELKVEIEVNEKEISKIKKGQKALIIFDAYPETTYEGIVTRIDPILSTLSRTTKVEIKIINRDLKIKPGMYASVKIQMPEQNAIVVPVEAIYRQAGTGNDFVYVITDQLANKIPVKRKYTLNNEVVIEGIEPDETIVIAGKNKLNEGSKVEIKENKNQ